MSYCIRSQVRTRVQTFLGKDKDKPDWKQLRDHIHKEGRISIEHCHKLLKDTMNIFSKQSARLTVESEPNVQSLHDPVTVVGDIHG